MRIKSVFAILLFSFASSVVAGPAIETWVTKEGATVMYVNAPTLPMVDVRVVFDGGSARDGKQSGVSSLVNNLLSDGAGEWNATQLAERFEDVGAQFSVDSLRDMAIVSVRSLTEEAVLTTALETIATVLSEPRFEPVDIERRQQQTLIALKKQQESPGSVASTAFYKSVYGDHPYAHEPLGTEESVSALTVDDIKAFFEKYYVEQNAVIAIVGDISRAQAQDISEMLMKNVPAGEKPLPIAQPEPNGKHLSKVSFPATQTHIHLGQLGMVRMDPDYFPLYVGNHMLGGSGLVSMLSEEVREERGLSYSVYSYFIPMRQPGPFLMVAQTKNDNAEEALQVMMDTLNRFVEKGPTADRLESSKMNITGGFPLRVSSNSKIVEYLSVIGFYGLPLDYLETFVDKVNAVTLEQIRSAFRRRVNAENFSTIIVGGTAKTDG